MRATAQGRADLTAMFTAVSLMEGCPPDRQALADQLHALVKEMVGEPHRLMAALSWMIGFIESVIKDMAEESGVAFGEMFQFFVNVCAVLPGDNNPSKREETDQ